MLWQTLSFDWGVAQVLLWAVAGLMSFYFSFGSGRVWTSIAVGFFLVLLSEVIPQAAPFFPRLDIPQVEAMGYIVSTLAILVMTHGFQEYYVFSRTFEMNGRRRYVYLGVLAVILASVVFILINPVPDRETLKIIRIVGYSNWVFLSLINVDMIRKIHVQVAGSPISRGFIGFLLVFFFFFLWKGSALYLEVYHLDLLAEQYTVRYMVSMWVGNIGNILASLSVGGTFLVLARALR